MHIDHFCDAFWFNSLEKLKIKSPKLQTCFFILAVLNKYLAKLISTIEYKIIELSFFSASDKILKIWFSVLKWISVYFIIIILNCAYSNENSFKHFCGIWY